MKTLKKTLLALIVAVLVSSTAAFAAEGSSRSVKKLSLAYNALSYPYPSISGFSVGYSFNSWFQVQAAYGAPSMGAAVRLFVPSWNLSPFIGGGYSILNLSSPLTVGTTTISSSQNIPYWTAGLEWQTHYGLLLGVTYSTGLSGVMSGIPLPGFRLGWSF